jgi:hypothetical protein
MITTCRIDWNLMWTAIAAIGAAGAFLTSIVLTILGLRQLGDIWVTGSETFLQNLKKDFFTKEARYILALMENKLLVFKTEIPPPGNDPEGEFAYFEIKSTPSQQLQIILKDLNFKDGNLISSYEVDDFLLQHLEDIGFLYKKKLITIKNVDQLFGYYIESVFESSEIKKYVAWARANDDDIYSNFEFVYNDLVAYLS